MRYGYNEISELDDQTLTAAYHNTMEAEKLREKAKDHPKFNNDGPKKMEFPPINPRFEEMKNEIIAEMKKRKLLT